MPSRPSRSSGSRWGAHVDPPPNDRQCERSESLGRQSTSRLVAPSLEEGADRHSLQRPLEDGLVPVRDLGTIRPPSHPSSAPMAVAPSPWAPPSTIRCPGVRVARHPIRCVPLAPTITPTSPAGIHRAVSSVNFSPSASASHAMPPGSVPGAEPTPRTFPSSPARDVRGATPIRGQAAHGRRLASYPIRFGDARGSRVSGVPTALMRCTPTGGTSVRLFLVNAIETVRGGPLRANLPATSFRALPITRSRMDAPLLP